MSREAGEVSVKVRYGEGQVVIWDGSKMGVEDGQNGTGDIAGVGNASLEVGKVCAKVLWQRAGLEPSCNGGKMVSKLDWTDLDKVKTQNACLEAGQKNL